MRRAAIVHALLVAATIPTRHCYARIDARRTSGHG
jgi:hypothetical protein